MNRLAETNFNLEIDFKIQVNNIVSHNRFLFKQFQIDMLTQGLFKGICMICICRYLYAEICV